MNQLAISRNNNPLDLAQKQIIKAIDKTIQDKNNSYRGIAMTYRKFSGGVDGLDTFKSFLLCEDYKTSSKENVYNYFRSIANKNITNKDTKDQVISELQKTFNEAIQETKKSKNRIEKEQDTMKEGIDYLLKEDIKKVCDYLLQKPTSNKNNTDKQGNIKLSSIIRFLFVTGCRVDELAQIQKDEIVLNGVAKIKLHGKGSKSRYTTIERSFYEEIDSMFNGNIFLFESNTNTKLYPQNLWKKISDAFLECGYGERTKKKIKKDGIEKEIKIVRLIHPHTLRHSFAMDKLSKGMDIKTLSELLGHSDISITLRTYIHSNPDKYKHLILEKW